MQQSSTQGLEFLCPDHQEKIIFFSQNSEPKCHMCLAKTEIPLDQFVKSVEKYRKEKISILKQSQSVCQQKISQFKKHLLMNKELFVKNIDIIIKVLDEKLETLMNDFNSEINNLGKLVTQLQINELKQYSKEMNQTLLMDSRVQQKDQILLFVIKEYETLLTQINIIKQLQDLQQSKDKIIDKNKSIDHNLCIAGNLNLEYFDPKKQSDLSPNQGQIFPLIIQCPPSCNCRSYKSISWNHEICGSQLYIDQQGEIFCKNYKTKKECQSYFIKNAKFKCPLECKTQQFQTASQFLMAFSRITQTQFSDRDLSCASVVEFCNSLNCTVLKRWLQ